MRQALRTLDANAERWLMLIAYTFCCFVIIHEVVRRFMLNYSAAWSQETAQFAFIYLGWIGAAFAVKERAHVKFDIVFNKLGHRGKAVLLIFGELLTMLFAVIALNFSMHVLAQHWQYGNSTDVLRINRAWAEAAVPLGFTLIVIRCIQGIARDIGDLRAGRPAFEGTAMFED
jgi:TRAP-type C4-dicarboxylate transport system permease small subunit